MIDIVITAKNAIGSGLTLARSIKKETNCKVFFLCTAYNASQTLITSNYVDEVLYIEDDFESEYINTIKEWYQQYEFAKKPILYFTTDDSCFYINENREWFEENFVLCLPSSEIIKNYTEKGLAEVDASNAGLIVPKTQIIDTTEDINKVASCFSFPVIIKPRATYLKATIDFKIKVINNIDEFVIETVDIINQGNTLLCQEYIPGEDDAIHYYLFYRGKNDHIYENMGRKTLQSTSRGGDMVKGIVEYNSRLSKTCHDFLNKIDYKGIGGIEFKKYNGKYYFIEMSTRLEGFFKIAEVSNSPLSLLSYYDLSDNAEKVAKLSSFEQQDGISYMDFRATLVANIKRRRFIHLFYDMFSAVFNPRTKLNIFSMQDQKPFWLTIKNFILR